MKDICDAMEKIVFPYFLRDDPLDKGRQPSLSSLFLLQLSKKSDVASLRED
jgi:hypothetical protein